MKILFVAMPFSIHTARWIGQLENAGNEIHFFSSFSYADIHPELNNIHYHEYYHALPFVKNRNIRFHSINWYEISFSSSILQRYYGKLFRFFKLEKSRQRVLEKIIKKIKPDIIHTLETQHAGYLVSDVKKNWKDKFPLWIHSNWGIDLHFFGKLQAHLPLIKQTLAMVDVFVTEGNRDDQLSKSFGFSGRTYTFPGGGGYKMPHLNYIVPSQRKKILVKGTQDIVRRGLVALRSLERCADLLNDYEIILYSSNEVTEAAAEIFFHGTGKKITVKKNVSHDEMLILNSEARLCICTNMSDGLPNAMLEAMMMGAFPVQSNTSMADEWIVNNKTGMMVSPEDPDIVESAIRKALQDDIMVDNAGEINRKIIQDKFDYDAIREKVIQMYSQIMQTPGKNYI